MKTSEANRLKEIKFQLCVAVALKGTVRMLVKNEEEINIKQEHLRAFSLKRLQRCMLWAPPGDRYEGKTNYG